MNTAAESVELPRSLHVQDGVAREEDLFFWVVKADAVRGVAGRFDELPAGEIGNLRRFGKFAPGLISERDTGANKGEGNAHLFAGKALTIISILMSYSSHDGNETRNPSRKGRDGQLFLPREILLYRGREINLRFGKKLLQSLDSAHMVDMKMGGSNQSQTIPLFVTQFPYGVPYHFGGKIGTHIDGYETVFPLNEIGVCIPALNVMDHDTPSRWSRAFWSIFFRFSKRRSSAASE